MSVVERGVWTGIALDTTHHYKPTFPRLSRLDSIIDALPSAGPLRDLHLEKKKPTAVLLVSGFSGLGIHSLLTIIKLFPRYFHNVVFMSVAVGDSPPFPGLGAVDPLGEQAG